MLATVLLNLLLILLGITLIKFILFIGKYFFVSFEKFSLVTVSFIGYMPYSHA